MPVKISQLPTASLITSDDFLPIVDSGSVTTQKATAQQVLDYITGSNFNSLNVTQLIGTNVQLTGNFSGSFTGTGASLNNIPNSGLVNSSTTVGSTTISLGSAATTIQGISVLTGSTITGSTALFTAITASHAGSGAGLTNIPNSALVNNSITVGSTTVSLGTTATTIQGISVLTGSTITGSTALFSTITASQQLISGDLRVLGTASIGQLNTITQQSLLIGDKYVTILSGGVDHTGINGAGFLWGTSSGPGETTGALGEHAHILYDASRDALEIFPGLYVTGSTSLFGVSGTTAQFTTLTASNISGSTARFTTVSASTAEISGNLVIYGSASLAQFPDYAYVLYTASLDKIVVYPGLYVSGNLTGSGLGAFQTVSASSYLGLPTSSGGTPGGTNTTIQFNSGSTFSGSTNLIWNYTNNRLGIGTTNPSTSLHVSGNTGLRIDTIDAQWAIMGANVASSNYMTFKRPGSAADLGYIGGGAGGALTGVSQNDLAIRSEGGLHLATGNSPRATITSAGNVGIGTTSPQSSLDVNGVISINGKPVINTQNSGPNDIYANFRVLSNDSAGLTDGMYINYNSTGGAGAHLRFYANSTNERMRIDASSGNVGIGTTNPLARLHVNGNTLITGSLSVTNGIFVSGSSIYGQVAELTSSTADYTLVRQDSGKFLNINSGSAVTVTVPTGLPTGFTVSLCQLGAGQITVSGAVGVTINNRQGHTKTAGQYSVVSLVGTSADTYVFVGDTGI